MINNIALLSLFLLLTFYSATGHISEFQQEPEKASKNIIYSTVGFFPTWGAEGPHFVTTIAALTGSKNSHFDAGPEFTILNDNYYHENSF